MVIKKITLSSLSRNTSLSILSIKICWPPLFSYPFDTTIFIHQFTHEVRLKSSKPCLDFRFVIHLLVLVLTRTEIDTEIQISFSSFLRIGSVLVQQKGSTMALFAGWGLEHFEDLCTYIYSTYAQTPVQICSPLPQAYPYICSPQSWKNYNVTIKFSSFLKMSTQLFMISNFFFSQIGYSVSSYHPGKIFTVCPTRRYLDKKIYINIDFGSLLTNVWKNVHHVF